MDSPQRGTQLKQRNVLQEAAAQAIHQILTIALEETQGNVSETARLLNMRRCAVYRYLRLYGVEMPEDRPYYNGGGKPGNWGDL